MNNILKVPLFVYIIIVSGCAGSEVTRTTVAEDPTTGKPVTTMVTNKSSFWKSENQQMHYDFENNRVDKSAEIAKAKLESMDRAAIRRSEMNLPLEARAYADAFDMYVRAQIQPAIPASGMPAPKNMADVANGNLVPILTLGLGVADAVFDLGIDGMFSKNGGEGSTYLEGVTAAGDIFINSQRNDSYNLSDDAVFTFTESPALSWHYETYTSNAVSSAQDSNASTANPVESGTSLF